MPTTIAYWLAVKAIPRLATDKKLNLVDQFGLVELFLQLPSTLKALGLTEKQQLAILQPNWQRIEQLEQTIKTCGCGVLTYADELYPEQLKQIYDPPLLLYYLGDGKLLSQAQLALVGSRSASLNARYFAEQLAQQLAVQGFVITSGLAIGIDSFAHKGALSQPKKTIAVVATGLDQVYPSRNRGLQQQILQQGGCVVSEFLPGTQPKAGHFPKRNRIISGLSKGVVVIEAALKSGSLITARCALEQNRDVFAVPGSIFDENNQGAHWLIKQGAKLIENAADIVMEYQEVSSVVEHSPQSDKNDKKDLLNDPLLASVGYETTPVELIVSRSELPTEVVMARLTILELSGQVAAVPGGYLRLHRGGDYV